MNNENFYKDELEKCKDIRIELDDVHNERYKACKKVFGEVLAIDKKHFKQLVDLEYYKGGYPKEDSEPKIYSFLDSVGSIFVLLKLLGKEQKMNSYLEENFGIKINELSESCIASKFNAQIAKESIQQDFDFIFSNTKEIPSDSTGVLANLLSEGLAIQKEICSLADAIKIDSAKKVEEVCNIKSSNFIKAVKLSVKEEKKGKENVLEEVKKISEEHIGLMDAIDPVVRG